MGKVTGLSGPAPTAAETPTNPPLMRRPAGSGGVIPFERMQSAYGAPVLLRLVFGFG